jgi:hypothetical protein
MRDHTRAEQAAGFLLRMVDGETAGRVRERTGMPGPEDAAAVRRRVDRPWAWAHPLPASVVLWILQQDDPDLNALMWSYLGTDAGLRRAVARGLPFGPGHTKLLPVRSTLRDAEPETPESHVRLGLVGALRAATTMSAARAAVSMVLTPAHWAAVAAADRSHPLPGYSRWALSVRPDCPAALRAGFGTHPKFTHRVRQAGVLADAAEYATTYRPAARVLQVLSVGHVLFPARVVEAEDALRPLVREHLGDREEAWAVLVQIVDTFHGTAPELMTTAGAIA